MATRKNSNTRSSASSAGTGHDQLAITGTASLDGTLDIQTDAGFTPGVGAEAGVIGDSYVIVSAGSVSGTFATINGRHMGSGKFYDVAYNATNVTLGAFQAAAGDADGDRDVDITDFNSLANGFDPSGDNAASNNWMTADFDADGDVDITDFNALSQNFAPLGYGAGGIVIPEPTSGGLLLLALVTIHSCRLRPTRRASCMRQRSLRFQQNFIAWAPSPSKYFWGHGTSLRSN